MATIAEQKAELETRLSRYIQAEQYLLVGGQSYSIGNRSLTRADLEYITKMIVRLRGEIAILDRGNQLTSQAVVPGVTT